MRFLFLKQMLLGVSLLLAPAASSAATIETIDVGTHNSTFSGSVRGFWFTAPTDFWIVGLDVPTDASSANFNAAILRLPSDPPTWSATTSTYDVLYDVRDQATGVTGLNIAVTTGDVIGVLGNRGDENSYGTSPYATTILGNAVTLERFGSQINMSSLVFPGRCLDGNERIYLSGGPDHL